MHSEILIRWLHFVFILALTGAIFCQHVLLRPTPPRREIQRLAALDLLSSPRRFRQFLEDSAHSAPEEEPETVAKTIRDFAAHHGINQ